MTEKNILDEARRVLRAEAEAIEGLADRVGEGFVRAVNMIFSSKGRVVVSGMGKSGLVGKKIAATLASTGTPSFFLHPAEASHGDLGMVTRDDIVLAISNSGETEEIAALVPYLKRFNVGLIALSGNPGSTLAKAADVSIDISVREEACPMGIVPTASTAAAMAMGDAMAVALLIKRGFREEDFAAFHPGGSLGKKLFIKVEDLMHTGDSVPRVSPGASMAEAIIEMSSRRLGMTTVLDEKDALLGIITDGDIRRGMQKWQGSLFGMKAGEVMTRGPRGIGASELAAKALSVMQEHSITTLVVPDDKGGVAGVIHLHDILKKGIA